MLSSNLKSYDNSLRIIIPLVVAVHFLIAILLNGLNQEIVPLKPKKGVVVHSVKLSPKVISQPVNKPIAAPKSEAPAKTEIVQVKEEIKPIPTKAPAVKLPEKPAIKPVVEKQPVKVTPKTKPIEPKKQTVVKNKIPDPAPVKPDNKEWIALAKEKIGKIALSSDRIPSSSHQSLKEIATPSPIENFITDLSFVDSGTTFNVKESAYRDELGQRLRLYLKLPEYGEVKVKLTIDRMGKVTFTKVLSFQSAKNASFIEQQLPKLKMPPFGDNFKGASDYDFTIVLSNE